MVYQIDKKVPKDWMLGNRNIANSSAFAKGFSSLTVRPLFISGYADGSRKISWLIFHYVSLRNRVLFSYAYPDIIDSENETETENLYFDLISFLKSRFAGRTIQIDSLCFARNRNEELLLKTGFVITSAFTAYILDITNLDNAFSHFDSTNRNETRKAIKDGYEYKQCISLEEYITLSKMTYARSGKENAVSLKELNKWKKELSENILISGVYVNGMLVVASIILFSNHIATYFHGASTNKKARGASAFIQFKNIEYLSQKGVKQYDFSGAPINYPLKEEIEFFDEKNKTINTFKKKFGGEQQIHFLSEIKL